MTTGNPSSYQVSLPVFEGPLDLLLHLIERQELDITQVSLALVTNQYLEYLAEISERDLDNLADFVVIAARLLLIKSQVLLPTPPATPSFEGEDEDAGADLVQQLIEYRKFKEVAGWLHEQEVRGLRSYVRIAPAPAMDRSLELGDVTLENLLDALREVLVVKPPGPTVDGEVAPLTVTVADQMDLITQKTARKGRVSFLRLMGRAANRMEVIVTLLALLELVKQHRVAMRQDRAFGDILILGVRSREEGDAG
jgi:segregation and condensation protein A